MGGWHAARRPPTSPAHPRAAAPRSARGAPGPSGKPLWTTAAAQRRCWHRGRMPTTDLRRFAESDLLCTADARARGVHYDELRGALREGSLVRVRRGAYIGSTRWRDMGPDQRHRTRVLAAARTLREPVFSHLSAAALWGLPIIGRWPASAHVTERRATGSRSHLGVAKHGVAAVPERAHVDGVPVTTVARTIADLARSTEFASALAAADHALRQGMVTPEELAAQSADIAGKRDARRVARVVEHACPLAESVGESLSRARMIEWGLPAPVLQKEFHDADGLIGRVDFWWEGFDVVGEFDGRLKYRAGFAGEPRAAEQIVWDEKCREDRLRGRAHDVVRWTWEMAFHGRPMIEALARAGISPPS